MSSCNTRLKMKRNGIANLLLLILIPLACFSNSSGVKSDVTCLRSIKETLEDPLQIFSTWNFNNNSEGFICGFTGVECWSSNENRVLNIQLPNMKLTGPFPIGIRNCTSIQGLDLSGNYLSGSIPFNLPVFLQYIVTLDLSNNNLSGPIPSSIANMSFINALRLDNNHLTGQIPQDLLQLKRLKTFSVANNRLSGPVPVFTYTTFPEESYAHNLGLCGGPLKSCNSENLDGVFFSGFAVGCSLYTILSMWFMLFYSPKLSISNMYSYLHPIKKTEGRKHHLMPRSPQILVSDEISSEQKKVKSSVSLSLENDYVYNLQVAAMESFVRRLSLVQIKRATNDFDNKNVIGYGNMGVMYKGVLINNLLLAVKRIHKFDSFEKEFLTIIEILGRLQHTNLVPLIGFCFEKKKKFLVYKYMVHGSLHNWLHCRPQVDANKTEWTLRFKIAEGVARGLAWLHHNNVLQVAHLKISSKSVLLDDNFQPKISNFGNTMILMNARHSPSSGSDFVVLDSSPYKEDVYSFGILLLELITGKEPSTWINSPTDHMCGKEFNVIDKCLMGQGFNEEIYAMLGIAENCIQAHRNGETSMLQVYREIRAIGKSRNKISVDSCMNVEDHE